MDPPYRHPPAYYPSPGTASPTYPPYAYPPVYYQRPPPFLPPPQPAHPAQVADVSAISSLSKENEDLQSAIAEWKRECAEWEQKAKFWEKYAEDQLKTKNYRIRELENDVEVLEGMTEEQVSQLTKADIAGVEHSSALEDALDDAVRLSDSLRYESITQKEKIDRLNKNIAAFGEADITKDETQVVQQVVPTNQPRYGGDSPATHDGGRFVLVGRSHDHPAAASEQAGWRSKKGLGAYSRQAKKKHNSGRRDLL